MILAKHTWICTEPVLWLLLPIVLALAINSKWSFNLQKMLLHPWSLILQEDCHRCNGAKPSPELLQLLAESSSAVLSYLLVRGGSWCCSLQPPLYLRRLPRTLTEAGELQQQQRGRLRRVVVRRDTVGRAGGIQQQQQQQLGDGSIQPAAR